MVKAGAILFCYWIGCRRVGHDLGDGLAPPRDDDRGLRGLDALDHGGARGLELADRDAFHGLIII